MPCGTRSDLLCLAHHPRSCVSQVQTDDELGSDLAGDIIRQRMPPALVVKVPAQRLSQAFVRAVRRGVAELAARRRLVDGIAAVVPRAVGNQGFEVSGLLAACSGLAQKTARLSVVEG